MSKNSLNEYNSLGSFEATRQKNSMDVTPKHDDRIRAILKDCLLQFNSLDRKSITPYKIDLNLPLQSKILKDSIKSGFYGTYTELANNNPIKTIVYETQKRSTREKLHLKDANTKKKIIHFAYNNGKQTFLNASTYSGERHYILTERFDQFLLFNDFFVNQDKVMGLSMAFGVLGILASNENQTVLFDLNTGRFYPLNKTKMQLILKKDYPKLYKKYRNSPKSPKLTKEILNTIYNNISPEEFRAIIRLK